MKKLFFTFLCFAGVCGMTSCDFNALLDFIEQQEQNQNEEEGEDEGEDIYVGITRSEMNEKGYSIKLEYTDVEGYSSNNGYVVYTRKKGKERWDAVSKSRIAIYIVDTDSESAYRFYQWIEEDGSKSGGWEDEVEYYSTRQTVTNSFNDLIYDGSGLLQYYGFSKSDKQEKILDLPCDVWTGTYTKKETQMHASTYGGMTSHLGNTGEFYVWNELTLRTIVNDKVQTECTSIVVGLDDKPFQKTADITWIE